MRPVAHGGLLFLVIIGSLACSTTKEPPAAPGCTAFFSGDVTDTVDAAQCATTSFAADAGGWMLAIDVQSNLAGDLQVAIDLGTLPVAGSVSSDTIATWSAVTTVGSDACALGAGSAAVPSGSFTLAIASVSSVDGGGVTVHGTLDLVTYVHAPPATSCGAQEVENVEVRF